MGNANCGANLGFFELLSALQGEENRTIAVSEFWFFWIKPCSGAKAGGLRRRWTAVAGGGISPDFFGPELLKLDLGGWRREGAVHCFINGN